MTVTSVYRSWEAMAIKECEDTRRGFRSETNTLATGFTEVEEQAKGTQLEKSERMRKRKRRGTRRGGTQRPNGGWGEASMKKKICPQS